jgi:antitoxin component YwqK of YwqJK toxin-antitoxin module
MSKPRIIEIFYENGQLRSRVFRVNNNLHREDGPAYEVFHKNGKLKNREFWVNGKRLSKAEIQKKCDPTTSLDGKVAIIKGKEYILVEKK